MELEPALGCGESRLPQDWTHPVLSGLPHKAAQEKMKWILARGTQLPEQDSFRWGGPGQGEEKGTAPFSALPSLQVNGSSAVLGVGSLEMAVLASPPAHPSPPMCPSR